eukprot:Gb_00375 [translate_table: standard]
MDGNKCVSHGVLKLSFGLTFTVIGNTNFIASTPTLFPADYVTEFQNCFDNAPAVPFQEIEAIIRRELMQPLENVYEYIDPVPIASASIAQVHGARLKGSQKEVVIKVLKPGIEDFLIADLNFLYAVARIVEFLNPQISRIVGDIRQSMLEEVDFQKEAANIDSFRKYLETMGLTRQATAPEVYYHCSTRRVLTMERLYGVPLTDLDSIRSLVRSPEASLITALNVQYLLWHQRRRIPRNGELEYSLLVFGLMFMQETCGCFVMDGLAFLTLVCRSRIQILLWDASAFFS